MKRRNLVFAPVAILALMMASLMGLAAPAQADATVDAAFKQLVFNHTTAGTNYVNIVGTGINNGDKVLWKNVLTVNGITADVLAVTSKAGGPSSTISNYGTGSTGLPNDFRVDVNPGALNAYASFTFTFCRSGFTNLTTGACSDVLVLNNVQITGMDIDAQQFNRFSDIRGYATSAPTNITTTTTGACFPCDAKFAGIPVARPDDPKDQVVVSYNQLASTTVDFGANFVGTGFFALRWKAVSFGSYGTVDTGDAATVNFDINGGTGTTPDTVSGNFGQLVGTLPTSSGFSNSGNMLASWNTASDGSGASYAVGAPLYIPSGTTTLYAIWSPTGIPYPITYFGNGNTAGSAPAAGSYTSGGAPYTVAARGSLVKSGSTFGGWNTAADGSGTPYAVGSTYALPANLNLYAMWGTSYAVTYNVNGGVAGASPPASGSFVTNSGGYTILGQGSYTKAGSVFAGWNTAAAGTGTAWNPGNVYQVPAAVTLYAQWGTAYTITYNGNLSTSGTVPSNGTYVSGGVPYAVSENTGSLARTGYTFAGWNSAADGSGTSYPAGTSSYGLNANVTLYAQWTPVTYVISYDSNGAVSGNTPVDGSFTTGGAAYTVAGNSGVPAPLARPGYTFTGWNTAADGSGTGYGPGSPNLTYSGLANLTLYARWTQNPSYAITYNQGSDPGVTGDVPAPGSYIDGGAAYTVVGNTGTPAVLSRPGYTFANWTTDPSGVGGTPYGPGTGNTTYSTAAVLSLYPQWTPWATMSVHVNSTGYGENYDGVGVEVSKDGGPFTYRVGTTDANGNWDAGSIDPNATYQVRLTQPCDSHASELKNPVAWGTGAYAPVLTLAATVPCAPVLSYSAASDTMSWTEPNDGGLHVSYYTYHYNTPARLSAGKGWAMFARYWPSSIRSVPFGTYASSGCPVKGTGVWPAANAGPAPYTEAPQCLRGLGAPARSAPYLWKVAARNGLPTAGVNTPAGGAGWGRMSDPLPITRPAA